MLRYFTNEFVSLVCMGVCVCVCVEVCCVCVCVGVHLQTCVCVMLFHSQLGYVSVMLSDTHSLTHTHSLRVTVLHGRRACVCVCVCEFVSRAGPYVDVSHFQLRLCECWLLMFTLCFLTRTLDSSCQFNTKASMCVRMYACLCVYLCVCVCG